MTYADEIEPKDNVCEIPFVVNKATTVADERARNVTQTMIVRAPRGGGGHRGRRPNSADGPA